MKIVLFLLFSLLYFTNVDGYLCTRPEVQRRMVYIYKAVSTVRNVKVIRCLYNDTVNSYYDISNNCLLASANGTFTDKFNRTHNIKKAQSSTVLEEYPAWADVIDNEIKLRSGTVCKYNRGFCYDPRETSSYAVVWNIPTPPKLDYMVLIFAGFSDIWRFSSSNLSYIFYHDSSFDTPFALRLSDTIKINNHILWNTDQRRYKVSFTNLNKNVQTLYLNMYPVQRKSKRFISEAILRDCDLRTYDINTTTEFTTEHIVDPEHLKVILNKHQSFLRKNYNSLVDIKLQSFNINSTLQNKIISELDTKIKQVGLAYKNLSEELHNLYKLNNSTSYSTNNKIQDKLLLMQKEFEQKFIAFKNSINYQLKPQLEAVNKSSKYCSDEIEHLKNNIFIKITDAINNLNRSENEHLHFFSIKTEDFENKIINLQETIQTIKNVTNGNLNKIEKSIDSIQALNKTSFGIEKTLSEKIDFFNSLNDKYSHDLSNLEKGVMDSFEKIDSNFKKLNTSFSDKSHLLDSFGEDLAKLSKSCKTIQNDFKDFSETKIIQVVTNILNNDKKYANDIELKSVEKLKPIFEEFNKNRKVLMEQVKQITEDINDNIKKELTNNRLNIEDISKKLNEETKMILNKTEENSYTINNEKNKLLGLVSEAGQHTNEIKSLQLEVKLLNLNINASNQTLNEMLKDYLNSKKLFVDEISNLKLAANQEIKSIHDEFNTIRHRNNDILKEFQLVNETIIKLNYYFQKINETVYLNKLTEINSLQKVEPILKSLDNKTNTCQEKVSNLSITVQKVKGTLEDNSLKFLTLELDLNTNIANLNSSFLTKENITKVIIDDMERKLNFSNVKINTLENNIKYLLTNTSQVYNATQENMQLSKNLESRLSSFSETVINIEQAVLKFESDQTKWINQSLKIDNTIGKALSDLSIVNVSVNNCIEDNKSKEERISLINLDLKNLRDNLTTEVNNLNKLNDFANLKTELEKYKELFIKSNQSVTELRTNVEECNNKQTKNTNEILELKKELQEIKNENQKKNDLLNNSLEKIYKLLDNKDNEIITIKADLKKAFSCCDDNTKSLLGKTTEINEIKNSFSKNVTSIEAKYSLLKTEINNIWQSLQPMEPDQNR